MSPAEFWSLTPYQTYIAVQGFRERMITLSWQIAALSRQKKLPKLETLLSQKKGVSSLKDALTGFKGKSWQKK